MYATCHLCAKELQTKPGLAFCETCWPVLLGLPAVERCQIISRAQQSVAVTLAAEAMGRLSSDIREMIDLSRQGEIG